MTPEHVKATAGAEESKKSAGQHPAAGILHQRRSLPRGTYPMALGGFLIAAAIGYFALYVKKKPNASAGDVPKVTIGVSKPEDTHSANSTTSADKET